MVEKRVVVVAFVVVELPIVSPPVNVVEAEVQTLSLLKVSPIVLAVLPLYVPEKVRVELVAVRSARLEPRAMPEIVELESIAFETEVHPPNAPNALMVVGS